MSFTKSKVAKNFGMWLVFTLPLLAPGFACTGGFQLQGGSSSSNAANVSSASSGSGNSTSNSNGNSSNSNSNNSNNGNNSSGSNSNSNSQGSNNAGSNANVLAATPLFLPTNATYTLSFLDEFLVNSVTADSGPYVPGGNIKWFNGIEQCCMSPSDGSPGVMYPTPVNGSPVNPYSLIPGGGLNISLTKQFGTWASGVMQSVDSSQNGFSQQYGYFEMSAALPSDSGTWPAFWLLPANQTTSNHGEIDVMEQYGQFSTAFCITLHDWNNDANSAQKCGDVGVTLNDGNYHTYGMLWTAQTMTFYLDGKQIWQNPTLAVMKAPYYMLVDLGIGGGWDSSGTTSPSVMKVKYVRAFKIN